MLVTEDIVEDVVEPLGDAELLVGAELLGGAELPSVVGGGAAVSLGKCAPDSVDGEASLSGKSITVSVGAGLL